MVVPERKVFTEVVIHYYIREVYICMVTGRSTSTIPVRVLFTYPPCSGAPSWRRQAETSLQWVRGRGHKPGTLLARVVELVPSCHAMPGTASPRYYYMYCTIHGRGLRD